MKISNFSPAGGATEPEQLPLENRLVRLLRAFTPYRQRSFSKQAGIHPTTYARYEIGDEKPTAAHLESVARVADLSIEGAKDHLRCYDSRGQTRLRPGQGAEPVSARLGEAIRVRIENAYHSLLRLPNPTASQGLLDAQMAMLRVLDEPTRSAVVKSNREFQTAALADRVAAEATARQSAGDAAAWVRLAKEIAHLAGSQAGRPPL